MVGKILVIRKHYDPTWLDQALHIYNRTEMKRSNRDQVHQAFSNSQVVVSAWQNNELIGVGRAISDFKMYSAIFDVVVDPDFQKRGVGKAIMTNLIEPLAGTCIYLTSTFGNEDFYRSLGFRFHRSALALYPAKMQNTPYLHQAYQIPESLLGYNMLIFSLGKLSDSVGCFLLNEQLGYKTEQTAFTKRFLFLMAHPEHSVIVAKNQDDQIVAWMHMGLRSLLEDDHFAQVAAIVVDEKERNYGAGTHLLKIAESWAVHHKMKQVRLHSSTVREKAHHFYLKNGYVHSKTSKLFTKELS